MMWRRGPFNPTVPSRQHEDGAEAHLHSPRRNSSFLKDTVASSNYTSTGANTSQMNVENFTGNMVNTESIPQRGMNGANGAQFGYIDPFNPNKVDTSCFDWPGTFGIVGHPQPVVGTVKGKSSSRRANIHSKISTSDISMPDYSSNSTGVPLMTDFQPMSFSMPNLDDPDAGSLAPKVPANTPTALIDARFVDEFGIDINKLGTPGSKFVLIRFFKTIPSVACASY